jgi:hypothetical protein
VVLDADQAGLTKAPVKTTAGVVPESTEAPPLVVVITEV